jgi:hypothetical protein
LELVVCNSIIGKRGGSKFGGAGLVKLGEFDFAVVDEVDTSGD